MVNGKTKLLLKGFTSDHVKESAAWTDEDKKQELRVTWSDFSLLETAEPRKLKMLIPTIKPTSKTDFVSMSTEPFAQVNV